MVLYKSILSPTKASESLIPETYSCGRWPRSSAEVVSSVLSRKDVPAGLQHLSWKKTKRPSKYADGTNLSAVPRAPGRARAAEKAHNPTGAHSVPAACLKWGFIWLALFISNEFADVGTFFIIFPLLWSTWHALSLRLNQRSWLTSC